jgi:PEP-CTERM motif
MRQLFGLMLTLAALPAWAGTPVPEPGVLPLLAIGAVGGIVLWVRNRNKKK